MRESVGNAVNQFHLNYLKIQKDSSNNYDEREHVYVLAWCNKRNQILKKIAYVSQYSQEKNITLRPIVIICSKSKNFKYNEKTKHYLIKISPKLTTWHFGKISEAYLIEISAG